MSDEEFTILRSVQILCRISSELRDVIVSRLLDVRHSAHFDLNMIRSEVRRTRNCGKLER